jgi:ADP-ribosylglycohydrolase
MASFTQKSCTPSNLLAIELEQSHDEGKDIACFKKEAQFIATIADTQWIDREQYATELFIKLQETPCTKNYPYVEPSTWSDICAHIKKLDKHNITSINKDKEYLFNRLNGGILGKCIGCLLGKPIEGWNRNKIISFLTETDNFPITKYLFDNISERHYKKYQLSYLWSFPITGMPEDDDINYLLIAKKIIEKFGIDFTSIQVAETWTNYLPILRLCTSERIAYRNFVNGIYPPESAVFCNPYREWIGAQIRADFFGYISPGQPFLAMKLAWKDACISHTKNGIYGAIWVAVIISLIPVRNSFDLIIIESLDYIPKKSRFYHAISMVIQWYQNKLSVVDALSNIHEIYSEKNIHHWCHVLSNAMIVAVALLWGENDFQQSLHLSLIAGFDTDSNGATVGSIVGYSIGANNIPSYWKNALKNHIYSSISGENITEISKLANEAVSLVNGLF